MPAGELFTSMEVELNVPVVDLMGSPKMKAICSVCGEEILNGREVYAGEAAFCRACAGERYYLRARLDGEEAPIEAQAHVYLQKSS
jgi:formylmethanofuran dehydrogenase subunit E